MNYRLTTTIILLAVLAAIVLVLNPLEGETTQNTTQEAQTPAPAPDNNAINTLKIN